MPHNYLQSNKKADKFKNVPSLSSLISWCSDILKGGNIVKLPTNPQFLTKVSPDVGMCYLESLQLVHRDLAARNVLLDAHLR